MKCFNFAHIKEGSCPKTHKFAYRNGKWCCQTNKDDEGNPLKYSSTSCQYSAYKQCPFKKCKQTDGKYNYISFYTYYPLKAILRRSILKVFITYILTLL